MRRRRSECCRPGDSTTPRTKCGAKRAFLVTAVVAVVVLTVANLSIMGSNFLDGGFLRVFSRWRRGPGGGQQDATVDYPCPYAIHTEKEALARGQNVSIPGNVVTVENLGFGRTGNRFRIAYRNLALGYCCKSKLVVLPPKDDVVAPEIFGQGTPGPRWFGFSSAPDVKGFDSSTCVSDITWGGKSAFRMEELETPGHAFHNPKLKECMEKVPRLVGCEAAYYFPQDIDVCHAPEEGTRYRNESRGGELEDGEGEGGRAAGGVFDRLQENKEGRHTGAGNLVIHIRSGDIFEYSNLTGYGQPPLQFYVRVMQNQAWDRVDVVTYADRPESLNPVVAALQARKAEGELMENFHIHTNRTIGQDLQTMLCADGLALAQSTLKTFVGYHSSAVWVFGALGCNRTLMQLAEARAKTMVYGVSKLKRYSVYESWENTPKQRDEMLTYNRMKGLKRCRLHYW